MGIVSILERTSSPLFYGIKKIPRIDYLVLTHPDPDHLKGLNFVASHFSIGQFWDNGLRGDSESYSPTGGDPFE